MTDWTSFPGAPAPGAILCAAADLAEGVPLCLDVGGFPVVLLRRAAGLSGFVNACPHQFLPLDHKGNRLLSEDGTVIRCTNHGAGFSVETGEGTEGLGLGECLDAIPVEVDGDVVVISG